MKTTAYLLIVSMLFLSFGCNSNKKVLNLPPEINQAFKAKYPDAKHINWSSEDSGRYEVNFTFQNTDYSSLFSKSSLWILTEKKVRISDLPATVISTLDNGFGEYSIKSIIQVESSKDGNYYRVRLKNGKEQKYLNLSNYGVILNIDSKNDPD